MGREGEVLTPGEGTASNSNPGREMTLETEQSHGIPGTVVQLAFLSAGSKPSHAATEEGTRPIVLSTIPSGFQSFLAEKLKPPHIPPKILLLLLLLMYCTSSSRSFLELMGIPGICPLLVLLGLIAPALISHKNH